MKQICSDMGGPAGLLLAALLSGGLIVVLVKETFGLLDRFWQARINDAKTMVYLIELERVVIYIAVRLLLLVEKWGIESVPPVELLKLHQALEDRYLLGDQQPSLFSKLQAYSIKLAEREPLSSLATLECINMLTELHHYSHRILGSNHDSSGTLDAHRTRRYVDTYLKVLAYAEKDLLCRITQLSISRGPCTYLRWIKSQKNSRIYYCRDFLLSEAKKSAHERTWMCPMISTGSGFDDQDWWRIWDSLFNEPGS